MLPFFLLILLQNLLRTQYFLTVQIMMEQILIFLKIFQCQWPNHLYQWYIFLIKEMSSNDICGKIKLLEFVTKLVLSIV